MTRPNPITTPRREVQAGKTRRTREVALDAFIARKAGIGTMLARLQVLGDEHFDTHPDEITWDHAGTLEHYAGLLKRVTDSAFGEGEHAE